MNVLLIGFRYFEIESMQDKLLDEFPEMKVDFAISVRDSWYRLKIASFDLIILDASSSEMESLVAYEEVVSRGNGIPVILLVSNEELERLSDLSDQIPHFLLNKDEGFEEKIIMMLRRNETQKKRFQIPESKKSVHRNEWAYFQAAMNASDTPMIMVNKELEIVEVNTSFLNDYHLSKNDTLGKPCFHVLHDHRQDGEQSSALLMVNQMFNSDLRRENYSEGENNHLPEGIIKSASPVRNSEGDVEHIILSLKANNRPVEDEFSTHFDKNLLDVLLNGLSDGLLFCDSDNKIILMNQTAEDLLGLPQENVIGNTIFDIPVGEGDNWLVEVLRTQKSQMRFNSFAYKTRLKDNYVQIRFAPLYSPEKKYLGGFLYMTEVDEVTKVEDREQLKILDKHIINLDKIITPKIIAEG